MTAAQQVCNRFATDQSKAGAWGSYNHTICPTASCDKTEPSIPRSAGLKVMVDCQSNSRHLLTWLMERLDADKDCLYLAAAKGLEQGSGSVSTTRTCTNQAPCTNSVMMCVCVCVCMCLCKSTSMRAVRMRCV